MEVNKIQKAGGAAAITAGDATQAPSASQTGPKMQRGGAFTADQAAPVKGAAAVAVKIYDIRETFKQMFGAAFIAQNPGAKAEDVGLRGKLYVNPDTRMLMTPDEVKAAKAAGTIGKTPYLSWFQEGEAKLAVPTEKFDAIHAPLKQAADAADMSAIIGKDAWAALKGQGYIFERLDKDGQRPFEDAYYDDKNRFCAKNALTIRLRQVDDEIGTTKGKFTAKIQGPRLGDVWVRGEVKFTADDRIPAGDFFITGKVPDEINPISYLKKAYPQLDVASIAPDTIIADKRHEFLVKKPDSKDQSGKTVYGEGLYLVTLDRVTGIDARSKQRGDFNEIELERTVASDKPADQAAQEAFTAAVKNRFGLEGSSLSKYQSGIVAIQKQNA